MNRVLYCHTSTAGGAELAAPGLAAALNAAIWVRGNGPIVELARTRGLKPSVLSRVQDHRPRGLSSYLVTAWQLVTVQFEIISHLRRSKPTVLISNSVQGLLHLVVPTLICKVPLVAYVRDLGAGGNRSRREVLVYRILLKACRAVIYNSEITKRSWSSNVPAIIVSTAVPDVFYEVGWTGGRGLDILMVGRIARWKGQANVIEALNLLSKKITNLRLTLVGASLFSENDSRLPVASFELRAVGHVEDVQDYMRESDVLVHASTSPEPFGQVLAQAAAVGVPIVCSNKGGQTEWLKDGVSALMTRSTAPEDIAHAISAVLADPDAARSRAAEANRAAQSFQESRAYRSLNSWLESMNV